MNGISFDDLLRYHEQETDRWQQWLEKQPPTVLDVPAGEAGTEIATVRLLVTHIFIVEWVYARTLHRQPYDDWGKFKRDSLAEIFVIHAEARRGLRDWVSSEAADSCLADATYSISGRGMTLNGSGRKFFVHTLMHGTRHWAQIAAALRQHGYKTDWGHDLVLSDAIK